MGFARSSIPAVAVTDSAKPGCMLCHGSRMSSTAMAVPNAGRAARVFPSKPPMSSTPAITAARLTLGSGPTITTKAVNAIAAVIRRVRLPPPSLAASACTAVIMRAQFAPDTARRCVSELICNWFSSFSLTRDVSPTAKPGVRVAPTATGPLPAASVRLIVCSRFRSVAAYSPIFSVPTAMGSSARAVPRISVTRTLHAVNEFAGFGVKYPRT